VIGGNANTNPNMSMKSSSRPADDELDRLVAFGIARQQVEPGDDCLDPEVLASYADGGLSAEERAAAEAHLARCSDCRRALALQIESDPLVASTVASTIALESAADGAAGSTQTTATGATSVAPAPVGAGSRGTAGRPGIVKFANTWLPLAAALIVATGLWFAFNRSRQEAPQLASAPAQVSARNEPSAAPQAEAQRAAPAARQSAPQDSSSTDRAAVGGAAPRELLQESSQAGGAAPSAKESSSRADAAAQAPPLARARGTFREEVAAAARPNVRGEADRRIAPAAAPSLAPPPPPPPPAALADAAPARLGGAAGQEAQAKVAGHLGPQVPPPAAPGVAAPAPAQTAAVNQNAASQQTGQQQTGQQQAASQQYVVNQQTGPMSNLNVASPPPAKADERRQADASKRDTDSKPEANEKSAGGPSSVKSVDGFAKAAEEPKSVARAKAAPASPAATAGADRDAAGRGAGDAAAGARAGESSPERGIAESITVITAAPALGPVLRSVDGARWWRIRAPSTIEGSADRGATWTVEYSDPSARLVRGTAAAKGGCWMIGASGLVLRTRPAGGWERVAQPTTRNLVTLTATDHLIATVTDDQGRTYRTTDGGATWR
jgi:hypothetical protein